LVSTAWLNFARTGNPSQASLAWKPYSVAGRETMVFDVTSRMQPYNDDKLQELLQSATPPRQPT
ncbi:MAG TPA: hypothetical protein VHZ32_03215, partial [Rhizomicrobium sp.]|nr:hypothetical protein [Rhizomicrobium sp.]